MRVKESECNCVAACNILFSELWAMLTLFQCRDVEVGESRCFGIMHVHGISKPGVHQHHYLSWSKS
eukprot:jgi/Botrbrau1/11553/Bobra.60_1s0007.1